MPAASTPGRGCSTWRRAPATRRSPRRERGANVTASDLTPELLEAGRARAEAAGLELDWVEADAENLPFEDESFDVVMSSIGAMFAPHHQAVADELVRVCRPGGTIGLLELDPGGHARRAVQDDRAVRAAAAARRAAPAPVGQRGAPARALRRPRRLEHLERDDARDHGVRAARGTTASTSRPATARRSPPARTRRRTAARTSSTRRSTRSATSGTAALPSGRGSRRSTWWRWVPARRGSAARARYRRRAGGRRGPAAP